MGASRLTGEDAKASRSILRSGVLSLIVSPGSIAIMQQISRIHPQHGRIKTTPCSLMNLPRSPMNATFPSSCTRLPDATLPFATHIRRVSESHHNGWVAATRCCNVRPSYCGDCARASIRSLPPVHMGSQMYVRSGSGPGRARVSFLGSFWNAVAPLQDPRTRRVDAALGVRGGCTAGERIACRRSLRRNTITS